MAETRRESWPCEARRRYPLRRVSGRQSSHFGATSRLDFLPLESKTQIRARALRWRPRVLIDERGRTYGSDVLVSGTTYAQSRLSFDRSALITQSVAPGGQATTFEYDGGGRLTSTRDALGNKSSRVISGGRVVAETAYDRINNADVLTAQTNISYDIDGNVSTVSHLRSGERRTSQTSRPPRSSTSTVVC